MKNNLNQASSNLQDPQSPLDHPSQSLGLSPSSSSSPLDVPYPTHPHGKLSMEPSSSQASSFRPPIKKPQIRTNQLQSYK